MPILRRPDDDAPLSQGDILQGLRLYITGRDWSSLDAPGESAERAEHCKYAMVVSRPCAIAHKPMILVTAIDAVQGNVPSNVKSFAEVQAFLDDLRVGYGKPDRFYLGQIPNAEPGRYYAHLDSFHTVVKPDEPVLTAYLKANRVATLADDFRRDLHLRILASVANLGFDDHGWLADQDLQWLVQTGEAELHSKRSALAEDKSKLAGLQASGHFKNPAEEEGRQKAIAKKQEELDAFEQEINRFRTELANRPQTAD